ncbi:MAG: LysE family translocator [Pseudomonadota bacterium]|nr:LysE family translocator [Pseudomonadota bacterium]
MSIEVIFALFIFAFVASITPGPNNIMLMASGTNFGFRKTFPHILGINIGFSTLVFGVGIGLMEVFNTIPLTQIILKFLCGVYLIYLSYRIATSSSDIEKNGEQKSKPLSFLQALLFQWVNPKGWSMSLTAISIYSPTNSLSGIILVTAAFSLANLPCQCLWALLGQQFRRLMTNSRLKIFNYSMAGLLLLTLVQIIIIS